MRIIILAARQSRYTHNRVQRRIGTTPPIRRATMTRQRSCVPLPRCAWLRGTTIQSITYLFCSSEEPSRLSEWAYQEYGITNGLKEMNPVT
jgi:hypothetical protein